MTAVEGRTALATREEVLEHLLQRTSRTFALVIPRLPEPTRGAVTVAYLLLRLADTVEDSPSWPVLGRQAALGHLAQAFTRQPAEVETLASTWRWSGVTRDDGCLELLERAPLVLEALSELGGARREVVVSHVVRSVRGMQAMLDHATTRGHQLTSAQQLRDYCYVVAGIVGELLTGLFLLDVPSLAPVAEQLEARAVAFGEGLQLVNILKDTDVDAAEGRCFVPPQVPRAELFALARADLTQAREYVELLRQNGAPTGMVAFTWLPVAFAGAALEAVEARGPGAKVHREVLLALVAEVEAQLAGPA
jgi:farnesyl-diphosphate farnesyltransferase